MVPCKDEKLRKMCSRYSDAVACCAGADSRAVSRQRERGKVLWGKADCLDLFELRKECLKGNYFKFRTASWCMFPVLQKDDILEVEHTTAGQMKVGDIPAYRSGDNLFAHRVVGKEVIGGREYIITRPDMSAGEEASESGERIPAEDILGRIRVVKRGGKTLSTNRRKATAWDRILYEKSKRVTKTRVFVRQVLFGALARVQSFRFYRAIAGKILKKMEHAASFQLALPCGDRFGLYEYKPLEEADISDLKEYNYFHIRVKLRDRPAGCVTFLNRPDTCPHKGILLADLCVRIRYGGMGFESLLMAKAKHLLTEIKKNHT